MNSKRIIHTLILSASALVLTAGSTFAQQTTGTPGSPSATTTIDGRYIPPPPPPFGGKIDLSADKSKPFWPPTVVPPKGAPNVLLIMTDDAGYGVSGTFGGVIPTPALDRIANAGLRYTQFHSTALCSPTRAALITGRNHHSVGFGVITEQSTGYPGYDSVIGPENATIGDDPEGERLRHVMVRQEPQHAELSIQLSRPVRPMAGRHGLRIFLRVHGRRDQTNGRRTSSAITTQIFPWIGQARLQPDHRHGGRGHQVHEGPECRRAGQAVLPLLRARRHACAAPADAGMDRQVQRQVRHGLERDARSRSSPTRSGSASSRRIRSSRPGRTSLPKWDTLDADEQKALRASGGGLCRLRGLHRP